MQKMISAVLLAVYLLMAGWMGPALAAGKKPPPPLKSEQTISKKDQQIVEIMEMLNDMNMLEHMDMMKDYDVIKGNAQNDKSD